LAEQEQLDITSIDSDWSIAHN